MNDLTHLCSLSLLKGIFFWVQRHNRVKNAEMSNEYNKT